MFSPMLKVPVVEDEEMRYQLVSSIDCYGIMSPERHQWDLALFTARNQPMEIIFKDPTFGHVRQDTH